MRIISNFKDYYDYVQNIYGIDHSITFNRINKKVLFKTKLPKYFYNTFEEDYTINKKNNQKIYFFDGINKQDIVHIKETIRYLILCDKIYRIKNIIETDYKNKQTKYVQFQDSEDYVVTKYNLDDHKLLYQFAKEQKCVCAVLYGFEIMETTNGCDEFFKIELNPNLGSLNLIQLMSPEEVYQKIEQYLINQKTNEEIISVDNNTKIIQAGFDLKTSFRKRKNQ